MNLLRLYIKDFMCHENSFIDFTSFNSALIVGKVENNDLYSNGVGKTSIFKAIEYALFNQADVNLEKIIRDDTLSCKVVIDCLFNNQIYRIERSRTRKGTTEISLYERNSQDGNDDEVLHSSSNDPITDKKYWKDISSRRAADTEKDLAKLLKINYKSFRVFVHFMQNDFSGLTTLGPEKRKGLLKEALNLTVYSKLEKMAKEKSGFISKEVDKFNTLLEALGDPEKDLIELSNQLNEINNQLLAINNNYNSQLEEIKQKTDNINLLNNNKNQLIDRFSALIVRQQNLLLEKSRVEISIKEYQTKKANVVNVARDLVSEIKQLEETQLKLVNMDFNQIDILSENIISNKEKIAQLNLTIQNDITRCEKLKIPIPNDGQCDHCRQSLTNEHRKVCQQNINAELLQKQENVNICKKLAAELAAENLASQKTINNLNLSKQHLDGINIKISTKKKEIADKRETHEEYKLLLDKFLLELEEKNKEIKQASIDLENSSANEVDKLSLIIDKEIETIKGLNLKLDAINKQLTHSNNAKAIVEHSFNKKNEDKIKKNEYLKVLKELEDKLGIYPSILQAFSSTGIPNLIIQNVLDDLQIEANNLLTQLRPGLQLSFLVEKVKGNGEDDDTLEINYQVNGKERYYEQLSGAMKLAVTFSLKLGLSFLLQKMIGVDIKFLLLDEIDQSLDKASVDAFADIVKFFQKDFTILVITHNDRLKYKFSHAILVEQDIDMVSRAKVVSSW